MWGSGKEMMKSFEKNRGQLNRRHSLKEKVDFGEKNSTKINSKKVSPQELELIKLKFIKKRKKQRKKELLILLLITISVIYSVYLIFK